MRYARYNNNPREITAPYDVACAETGKIIKKGESAIYCPRSVSIYHFDSRVAGEFFGYRPAQWDHK